MSIKVHIVDGPLAAAAPWPAAEGGLAGAVLCFEGVARRLENDRQINALDYEAYEPMASRQMQRLAEQITRDFGLLGVFVEHSRGRVPVGQCSFRLRVASPHRKEALNAVDYFIDRLKQDVPIWKSPVYADNAAATTTSDE
jgi:molybdopterin synthase catalytic subunit